VSADFDPSVDLSQYHTYDWEAPDALPVGDPRLDNNPFFDARVRAAVDSQLAAKGLRKSSASPDLTIHYHASVQEQVDVYSVDRAHGYTSEYGEGTEVRVYEKGTLVIDIAEAETKRMVWRGWAQSDIEGVIDRPPELEKRIREAVDQMFERFPRAP
jgi:hypothetical protein